MPYLNLNGERIYYALHRNQSAGIPVLLIHGAGENHLVWPMGLRRLPGAVVYAIDLPGHGKSLGVGRNTIAGYVEWLGAFCDALALPEVNLVGHSMGGAIAQLFALTYPSRTAGIVLIATGAKLRVAPQLLDLAQHNYRAAVDLISQWEWGPGVPEDIKQLGKQQLLAINPQTLLDDYCACDAFDVRERLNTLNTRTLIIAGEADQLTPSKHAFFMAEHIPLARLVMAPQTGHMIMLEAEDLVTRAVAEFLQQHVTE
jgi:pimeloyl-ACP methyl ester carboxylesterase